MLGLCLPIKPACDQCFLLVKTSSSFLSGIVSPSLSTPLLQLLYLKHQMLFSDVMCRLLTEGVF